MRGSIILFGLAALLLVLGVLLIIGKGRAILPKGTEGTTGARFMGTVCLGLMIGVLLWAVSQWKSIDWMFAAGTIWSLFVLGIAKCFYPVKRNPK